MGDPSRYPEIRMARFLYALQSMVAARSSIFVLIMVYVSPLHWLEHTVIRADARPPTPPVFLFPRLSFACVFSVCLAFFAASMTEGRGLPTYYIQPSQPQPLPMSPRWELPGQPVETPGMCIGWEALSRCGVAKSTIAITTAPGLQLRMVMTLHCTLTMPVIYYPSTK